MSKHLKYVNNLRERKSYFNTKSVILTTSMAENYENTMKIPPSVIKGEFYEVKIEHLYDLSKFWIIVQFKELAIFVKYLKNYYDHIEHRNIIPKNCLKKNMICIVQRNGLYYRSIVLPVLLPNKKQIRVFMIDLGCTVNIFIDDIYYICEKHKTVPRFAIRASLLNISPAHSETWSLEDLKVFCEIIEKRRIFAKVGEIDTQRNILFTEIYVASGLTTTSINNMLINLNLATFNKIHKHYSVQLSKYKNKVKYPHLFPSFEALESGIVPCSLWEKDLLKHSVPLDLLYSDYFQYQDIENLD